MEYIKNLDTKYEKWYYNIINKAKDREKDFNEYYEVHHILPKCMGGEDNEDNLVVLTYREHLIVHMLLCEIYPGNHKLIYASKIMLSHNKSSSRPKASTYLSTRTIARIKVSAINARKGQKMPEWFGPYIAQKNRERVVTEETKQKISNANKGLKRTEKQIEAIKKNSWKKGNIPWNKGKKMPEISKSKLSETRKRIMNDELRKKYSEAAKKRGYLGKTRKVQGPDGTIYSSTEECARTHNVASGTIRYWIKKLPNKGYKFID